MPGLADLHSRGPYAVKRSGKRMTLHSLQQLRRARVPPGLGIGHAQWREQRQELLDLVTHRFGGVLLAVRSDRRDEDSVGSNAGRYLTCLNVDGADRAKIAVTIDGVFASYERPHAGDEVFIQRQVSSVRHACVAFTHALPDGAPYYVLSIAQGPRSDHVTRGDGNVDSWYLARDSVRADALPHHVRLCLETLQEVESAFGSRPCEVEIAIDADQDIWLLQARVLNVPAVDACTIARLRRDAEMRLAAGSPHRPLLGLMPDWNPAELIGEHPRPLALDLFDRLLTRRAWRIGRAALGYARIGKVGLLQVHAGRPYVDVRTSFRSLLPRGLDPGLGELLVDAGCARLRAHPELHDKIEFEVVFSTLSCEFDRRFAERYPSVLDDAGYSAFVSALRGPTVAVLDSTLTRRVLAEFERDLQLEPPSPLRLRQWLAYVELRTAVRFAIIARQAFAVEALLHSAVDSAGIDPSWMVGIRHGVLGASGDGSRIDQGHVRAGTFEIAAPTRRELSTDALVAPEAHEPRNTRATSLAPGVSRRLELALRDIGLEVEPTTLLAHHERLLHAREFGKFVLSRAVSLTLDALSVRAQAIGIGRDDAGWLGLDELVDATSYDAEALHRRSGEARALHALEGRLRMPLLIEEASLDLIHHVPGQANYVGCGRVNGTPFRVDAHTHPDTVPANAIIAIASADPGFDWIFGCRPVALLTAFGGPNSHMAIRCADAGVPALFGIGPEAFQRAVAAARIVIDFDCRKWAVA